MKLRQQRAGTTFRIVVLELDNGKCPAIEYLRQLKQKDAGSHQSMHSRIKFRADNHPITNKKISRGITEKKYRGLLRLVAGRERLLYCFLAGGVVVLLNGYDKNDDAETAWDTALNYQNQLDKEIAEGQLEKETAKGAGL